MAKKQLKETPDELGFTPSDYYAMQERADSEGKLNDTLLSGWDITPEQIKLINSPRHYLHRIAVTCFYDVNFIRLRRMAVAYIRRAPYLISIVDENDLLQQLYADLLEGFLKLPDNSEQIRSAVCKCYRYAAVGGMEGVEDVKVKRAA